MVGRYRATSLGLDRSVDERTLRNEIRRHRQLITEWLRKRQDCAVTITNHRNALRKALAEAKRRGVEP